jgi:hypothetical protein
MVAFARGLNMFMLEPDSDNHPHVRAMPGFFDEIVLRGLFQKN